MDESDAKKKSTESENKKMFRSRFDIFVLNALSDKDGGSYGYDVINYIQGKTKGHYKIKTYSTIYNTLKRLEEQGYVTSGAGDGETNGAARVYYTLTDSGKNYLEANKQEYMYLRTLLDNLLTDEDFDLENDVAPYRASELKPLTKRSKQVEEDVSDELSPNGPVYQQEEIAAVEEQPNLPINQIPSEEIQPQKGNNPKDKQPTSDPKKGHAASEYKVVFDRITAPIIAKPSTKSKNNNGSPSSKYKQQSQSETIKKPENRDVENSKPFQSASNNMEQFRNNLRSEGFVLQPYQVVKNQQAKPSIYVNKLLRDVVILSALYMIAIMLMMYLLKDIFGFSLTALLTLGAICLAFALTVSVIWFRNPEKRRRDKINLKVINVALIAFFTVFFMVDIIVALLASNGVGLSTPKIYAPVLIASTSLFSGLVLTLLYKSDNYTHK